MCRIVGLAGYERGDRTAEAAVLAMTEELSHGGPDDGGVYTDARLPVSLGHRRLSILDLSESGHQPMSNADESLWITYNGEIYNYAGIRDELTSSGYVFRSGTDTEVIIYAFEKWGEKAFEMFNGMFSFCLLDKRREALYLVRDHAGIKPLYYSLRGKALVFASETKSFRTLDGGWEENEDWKIYLLLFGHVPEPYTTLRDVTMLPRGSYLKYELNGGDYKIKRFTDYEFTDEIKNAPEAEERIRAVMRESVRRHLISDAPIGVFLSGGVDSSLVAMLSHGFKGDALRTLSVVFDEKDYSEERYQRRVLDNIASVHRSYLVTERDFMDSLDDIFRAMDQPTTDGVNSYFISRCAHEEGLKAVLSGLGGDELFGGYPSFRRVDAVWPVRQYLGKLKGAFGIFSAAPGDRLRKLSFLALDGPSAYYLFFRGLIPVADVAKILGVSRAVVTGALEKLDQELFPGLGRKDFTTMLETDMYMKNQLLRDTDFMSMRHAVEVRVPFLDKEMMKLVFSISPAVKFSGKSVKPLLVSAFRDLLPPEISQRKKQGFSFPFQLWMRRNADTLARFIPDPQNPSVSRIVSAFRNNRIHWSRFWSLVVLGRKCAA